MSDIENEQANVHRAIEDSLELEDGQYLTGWIVVYEVVSATDAPRAGHLYGPEGMTSWRALGLTEWASRMTLTCTDSNDED